MDNDCTNPAFWDVRYPPLNGRTPRELLISEGGPDFVFENYITGEFGRRMQEHLLPWVSFGEDRQTDPELLAWWRARGIVKRLCPSAD